MSFVLYLIAAALFLLEALGFHPIPMIAVGLFCVALGLACGGWSPWKRTG